MRRILSLRIRRWYFKLLFIAVVWVAGYPLMLLTDLAPPIVFSVVSPVLTLAGVLLGARIFRGRDEPDDPSRPWWRMTARRRLSVVLGVLCALAVLSYGVNFVAGRVGSVADAVASTVLFTVLGFLYLNSAARLPATPPRVREVLFTPRVTLK